MRYFLGMLLQSKHRGVAARLALAVMTAAALLVAGSVPAESQPMLVTGSVEPTPADGAVATLFVWPDSPHAGVGDGFSLPIVGQALVEAGKFAIPVPADLSAIASAAATNGGHANFMVTVVSDTLSGSWSFTRSIESTEAPTVTVPLDTASPSSASSMQSWCLPNITTSRASSAAGDDDDDDNVCIPTLPGPDGGCYVEVIEARNAADTIGELHTPAGGSATYNYSVGSASDIGVGVAPEGGGWRTEGSARVTKTTQATTSWTVGENFAQQLQTYFTFRKYKIYGTTCPTQYMIKAETWLAGATMGVGVGQWDNQCWTKYRQWAVPQAAGTKFLKKQGAGFHYGIGATVFGINLHSRSDWTTQHSFEMNFGLPAGICGNDGPAPSSSLVYKDVYRLI